MKFVVVAVGGRVARWIGMLAGLAVSSWAAPGDYPPGPQIARDGTTVWLVDYVRVPPSRRGGSISNFAPPPDYSNQLARVNFLRSEPVDAPLAAARFFVNDLNRNLYILRRADRTWVTYLNFQSIFPRFDNDPGYAGGLVTFAFDPAYASNGVFYTVHTEDPASAAPALPTNLHLPALDLTGYAVTPSEDPPAGTVRRQAVLVEWRDVNITNETFEGTAREVLRIGFNGNSHPLGDLIFNPRARPGDPDYRNLYLACGDGASGEVADARHTIPQRLDALQGKILRLTPDVTQRPDDPLGPNGRYRIPATGSDPNPFIDVALPGLRKEIFALGLRNPHRLSWDAESGALWVNDIGLHSWEEVNLVRKGANYGYAEREGTEELFIGGTNSGLTGGQANPPIPFPEVDSLVVTGLVDRVAPVYPVAQYSHRDGDAISSGYVYRGQLLPELRGQYVFADITTARLFRADLAALLAADDGNRATTAPVAELTVLHDAPDDTPDRGAVPRRLFDIVAEEYARRGGDAPGVAVLPGSAAVTAGNDPEGVPYGRGRADIRLAMSGEGELFVLSKSDGMIRWLTSATAPRVRSIERRDAAVRIEWDSVPGRRYRVEFKSHLAEAVWTPLGNELTAAELVTATEDTFASEARFYRVLLLP